MNINQSGQQQKTETNPRGAGRRPGGGGGELKRMRAGVLKYVKEQLAKGETPSQYLIDYAFGDRLSPLCSESMQEAVEDLVTTTCVQ